MKKLGFLLITIGFVWGSYFLVSRGEDVGWWGYSIGLLMALTGVVMARRAEHQEHTAEDKLAANLEKLKASLDIIVKEITGLNAEKENIDVYDIPDEIDRRFFPALDHFVESRKSMIHAYDLQTYADLMSYFASAERHLNRAWSCSVDGYIDEAHLSLENAREQFEEVKKKLSQAQA